MVRKYSTQLHEDFSTTWCCRRAQRTRSRSGVRTLMFLCSFKSRLVLASARRRKNAARRPRAIAASLFCQRAVRTDNMTTAVMFWLVSGHRPTILADECDKWAFLNEELVGLFNSGHRKGENVMRCEGDSSELRSFNVYAPVALATIGALPSQLHSRSIVIRLERATRAESRRVRSLISNTSKRSTSFVGNWRAGLRTTASGLQCASRSCLRIFSIAQQTTGGHFSKSPKSRAAIGDNDAQTR